MAVPHTYNVNEDSTLTESTPGVLDGAAVDVTPATAVIVSTTSHGTLNALSDGSFTYTPNANYYGTDTFVYKVQDANGLTSPDTTVTITVGAFGAEGGTGGCASVVAQRELWLWLALQPHTALSGAARRFVNF